MPGRAEYEAETGRTARRRVARAVRMQLVTWLSRRRIWLKFRLEFTCRGIEHRGVEIAQAVDAGAEPTAVRRRAAPSVPGRH